MSYKNFKAFHYYPVDIKQAYTGKKVKGFKFPEDGHNYSERSPADVETYNKCNYTLELMKLSVV